MPITITQALIDRGTELLVDALEGKKIAPESVAHVIFCASAVVARLLKDNTKHEYKIQLATGILHKLVDLQTPKQEDREFLHNAIDFTVLEIMPPNGKCCFSCS